MANALIRGIEVIINGVLLPFNAIIVGLNTIPRSKYTKIEGINTQNT